MVAGNPQNTALGLGSAPLGVRTTLSGFFGIGLTPVIGPDGTIYSMDGVGQIYALTYTPPADPQGTTPGTLTQKWSSGVGTQTEVQPVIGDDGTLYVGTEDHNFYAITDNGTSASIKWHVILDGPAIYSPAVKGSTVYVPTLQGVTAYVDNGTSASIAWQIENGWDPATPAVASDGTVYVSNLNNGILYAVSPSGTMMWQTNPVGGNVTPPVVGPDGTIYMGGPSGVYAFTDNGSSYTQKWCYPDPIYNPLALGPTGTVYFVDQNRVLISLTDNGATCAVNWQSSDIPFSGGPSIAADGTIYVPGEQMSYGYPIEMSFSDGFGIYKDLGSSYSYTTYDFSSSGMEEQRYTTPAIASDGTLVFGRSNSMDCFAGNVISSVFGTPASISGGGQNSTGEVDLEEIATSNSTVYLSSNNADVQVPASVTVPAGSSTATFLITASGVGSEETASITARLGYSTMQGNITVEPAHLTTCKAVPGSAIGGNSTNGEVILNGKAPTGGAVVSLLSSSGDAVVPATVTVPAGKTFAYFSITTSAVSAPESITLTATYGTDQQQGTLTLNPAPITTVKFLSSYVEGPNTVTGEVILGAKAPAAGDVVSLSSNCADLMVPSSVTIPAGQNFAFFTCSTNAVNPAETASVTATLGPSQQQASIPVTPPVVTMVKTLASSVQGGSTLTGEVILDRSAPAGGEAVSVQSSSGDASFSSVTVPAGQSYAYFTISAASVGANEVITLTATAGGPSKTCTFTISGPSITLLKTCASTVGPQLLYGEVVLNRNTPGALTVALQCVDSHVTIPSSVTVPAGQNYVYFPIQLASVSVQEQATLTATVNGGLQSVVISLSP